MNTKICTSIEQSKKLIELGIDVNTADMWWNIDMVDKFGIDSYSDVPTCYNVTETDIPAWSLSTLLIILAEKAFKYDDDGSAVLSSFMGKWHLNMFDCPIERTEDYDDPLDAAFEMVCWLLENKKL